MVDDIISCSACKRINIYLKIVRDKYPNYYNLPVPGRGSISSKICIIGLAPGLHGANKTGMVFTNDFCSNILKECLIKADYYSNNGDPIFYITNALKCLPPANSPKISELNRCTKHLKNELQSMNNLEVVIALGMHAHNSILKCYDYHMSDYKFKHGNIHKLREFILYDSYHCSRINIQTKRLTKESLCDVLKHVKKNIIYG
tara:strand:- start:1015 stop:1620 length:606 start_codon:yes stop_codon:yes gene_type:complete